MTNILRWPYVFQIYGSFSYECHLSFKMRTTGTIQALCTCMNSTFLKSWWRHQVETFPRCWPFVRGIHRSSANSPHKGQWRGALMFSLICAWTNGWVNNRYAGDLRCHCAHYDVTRVWWHQTVVEKYIISHKIDTLLCFLVSVLCLCPYIFAFIEPTRLFFFRPHHDKHSY